jgi:ABC-type multidrug transport system ATPase subunit
LLLADEPTSGLDPVAAAAVIDILVEARDTTVIVSTHDLDLAARFDRVIALRGGRIVHDGGSIDAGLATVIYGRDEAAR